MKKLKINYVWAMPNKWTFKIKPIAQLLERYNTTDRWVDPFAGMNSPAQVTNDHRENMKAKYHLDAVDFVKRLKGQWKGALFDPPYSIHEVKRHYDSLGLKYDFKNDPTCGFRLVKDIMKDKIELGGLTISFGWNTVGFGKKRGFEKIELLIICHGGNRNDTLVTIERKIEE